MKSAQVMGDQEAKTELRMSINQRDILVPPSNLSDSTVLRRYVTKLRHYFGEEDGEKEDNESQSS